MGVSSFPRRDLGHSPWLDGWLILLGALFAWLLWPSVHP